MPVSNLRLPVADHSWKIFGAMVLVVSLGLVAAYCVWRAFPARTEALEMNTSAAPVPSVIPRPPSPPRSLPVATHPLWWQDLILMLRAGYSDDEIIAATRDQELVSSIGSAEAATLRDLGAGNKLLSHLRTRPVYAAPSIAARVIVTAPALASVSQTAPSRNAPTAAPVNYAARDRQVKNLQRQIDALDGQIRRVRANPDPYHLPYAAYNGRGDGQGDESSLKKYLDQLDQQRNDLRRQKWQLEGR